MHEQHTCLFTVAEGKQRTITSLISSWSIPLACCETQKQQQFRIDDDERTGCCETMRSPEVSQLRACQSKTNSLIALGHAYATPTNWLEVERDDMIAANIKHVLDPICEVLLKRLSSTSCEPESVTFDRNLCRRIRKL